MISFKEYLQENWSYAHDFYEMPESEKQKYVFHITTPSRAKKILKKGLRVRSGHFKTNYPDLKHLTSGRAFVTNHQGVRYWEDQTLHAINNPDGTKEVSEKDLENITILKFPFANLSKSNRRKITTDEIGTRDARRNYDDPEQVINPSSHEAPTAFSTRKRIK